METGSWGFGREGRSLTRYWHSLLPRAVASAKLEGSLAITIGTVIIAGANAATHIQVSQLKCTVLLLPLITGSSFGQLVG